LDFLYNVEPNMVMSSVSFYMSIDVEHWPSEAKCWRPLQIWEQFNSLTLSIVC